MLEHAVEGKRLEFPWYELPVGRALKAWSKAKNLMGKPGKVPDGMSAAAALRNLAFSKQQEEIAGKVTVAADEFERKKGYPPPYWRLVELARTAHDKDNS
jgi:hypothetical protein